MVSPSLFPTSSNFAPGFPTCQPIGTSFLQCQHSGIGNLNWIRNSASEWKHDSLANDLLAVKESGWRSIADMTEILSMLLKGNEDVRDGN